MIKTSKLVILVRYLDKKDLKSVIFLGYHPPVNEYKKIGTLPEESPSYPCELLFCEDSKLAQLGLLVDQKILFPSSYPYTSSTTKILRDNFANLYEEVLKVISLKKDDLVIDIGSNDGNLLSNLKIIIGSWGLRLRILKKGIVYTYNNRLFF